MKHKNRKMMENFTKKLMSKKTINESGGKKVAGGSTWSIRNWDDTFEVKSVNDTAEFDMDELDELIKGLVKLKKIVGKL